MQNLSLNLAHNDRRVQPGDLVSPRRSSKNFILDSPLHVFPNSSFEWPLENLGLILKVENSEEVRKKMWVTLAVSGRIGCCFDDEVNVIASSLV